MPGAFAGLGLLIAAQAAAASTQPTDFGVRAAPGSSAPTALTIAAPSAALTATATGRSSVSLSSAVAVASRLGRVTSTRRSVSRNRAVGGVANSYHLSGRAIDVVPRPGVRHRDIDAALRRAGFNLVESLDEGDHSHFAFGTGPARVRVARSQPASREVTEWRIVAAPRMASR